MEYLRHKDFLNDLGNYYSRVYAEYFIFGTITKCNSKILLLITLLKITTLLKRF